MPKGERMEIGQVAGRAELLDSLRDLARQINALEVRIMLDWHDRAVYEALFQYGHPLSSHVVEAYHAVREIVEQEK
jgi:hypothetical protein